MLEWECDNGETQAWPWISYGKISSKPSCSPDILNMHHDQPEKTSSSRLMSNETPIIAIFYIILRICAAQRATWDER